METGRKKVMKRANSIGDILRNENADDVLIVALPVDLQRSILNAYNMYVTAFNDGVSSAQRKLND
jgi:hypothetical protein